MSTLLTLVFMSEIVNPPIPTTTKSMVYAILNVQIQPILLKPTLLAKHVFIHVLLVLIVLHAIHVQPIDSMMQLMIVFALITIMNTIKIVELAITHV